MTKAILFKTLVDILYFLHFIGLIGLIFILPFGIVEINQVDVKVEGWTMFTWLVAIFSLIAYLIFLRGLYFLRKMARFLLSKNYFSDKLIKNLKRSGTHFILTGVIAITLLLILWFNRLYGGTLELSYDANLIVPLFLMIIGMFFIIQSNALVLAKNINEENKLTV